MGKRRRKKKAEKKARAVVHKPTPGLVVRDPIAEKIDRLEEMEREYKQIRAEIDAAIAESKAGHEDALDHAAEMIEKSKRGRSVEELEKIKDIAAREQLREISERRADILRDAKALLTGPKMTFTPQVDDLIVMGGAHFYFTALVEDKYPKTVISAYMDKRQGLADRHRTKTMLGAAGPGYAAVFEPICVGDYTGQVFRPMAEHRALLAEAGIEQTLE